MSEKWLYGTIGAWIGIVAVVAVVGLLAGVPITVGTGILVLVLGIVPPAVVLKVFGGVEPQTVAELLRQ